MTSGVNPGCIQAETVFGAVRRQGNPDGLVTAGVFGKPKLGRLFAGGSGGREHDADYLWAPCADDKGKDDDDYCAKVPLDEDNGYAKDDATPMNAVLDTMRRGVGKAGRRPDFTFVNLQQVDATGHKKGTGTGEYDRAIGAADAQIKRLVDELKARGEWSRTTLILLSDHSMDTTPRLTNLTKRLSAAKGVRSKDFLTVLNGSADMVYLADRKSRRRHVLLKRMRAAALRTPGRGRGPVPPAQPGRRRAQAHPARRAPRLAPGRPAHRRPVRDRPLRRRVRRARQRVGGQPRRPPDARQLLRGDRRRRPGAPGAARGQARAAVRRHPDQPAPGRERGPGAHRHGAAGPGAAPATAAGASCRSRSTLAALPGAACPPRRPTIRVRGPRGKLRGLSCRQAKRRRVPVTVDLRPSGWRFDLSATEGGTGRRLLSKRNSAGPTLTTSLRPGTTVRFVASLRAASGKTGPDRTVSIKAAAPRC